ncbi:reticulocyte binding protein [Lactiplantibacillus plantarum]|nr:reticulocyte binding protein [Lactiplantibacillus plantarum]MCG0880134.1 reticulocyte binding protein [Lactiplantibacillus plantarum]
MIKFYDSGGTVHFGQATITRKTSVNGGLSLTGEVFAGGDVLNGLDYGWWLNFDNEKYVITYKKLSDDTNTVVFDAVQQFFWDFAKVALHAQYTGSHEYSFYLGQLFDKSGYTYKNDVAVPAFEKENWGYKNKLDLFNDIIDQAGVEFEVHNETVHIAKQIGSDLTSFVRKGINLSDLTEEMKISDFATYARGYGAFKDDQDQSKGRLEVEYRSELAKQFGDLEMDPIVDERYTIADNLIAALKKQVDATYTVSMTMNIYDLENAGYPNYEAPKVGDWILAIDEALNFKRKIRIIQLEEQFDVTGKRIGYTATCGDLSIVDQYTHLQSSLDSKVQRIQETVDTALTSANGKNTNYYGAKEPVSANEGDLWFDQSDSDPDKWSIKQWVNGRWEQITLNPGEVDAKVDVAKKEAETAVENAKSASDKADQLAAKYDDTNALANQALEKAVGAQSDASAAVATANSTASEFGKVDQKAESALANALGAQSDASIAVAQASSAAADSKDAKQIAGAVSQSYKTLTDGSTMTIAELENGLATKLTKTDLDGYATQTWTQNQIKVTADGINSTLSSVKTTVDGQTTSINDLKADSNSFKSQFTTVNNTLGKQSTDIGSLQASSKELTTGFNTLTSDNTTNKNDISQLKQTSTELSSTMETVQTQVQNSAVGTNLYTDTHNFDNLASWWGFGAWTKTTDTYNGLAVMQTIDDWNGLSQYIQVKKGDILTYSVYAKYISGTGTSTIYWQLNRSPEGSYSNASTAVSATDVTITDSWTRVSSTTVATSDGYLRPRIERTNKTTNTLQIAGIKVEKGSIATDWCPNPADNATVTAVSTLSQTVDGMQLDISKKIEQKDLNGYATETWTQNQIQTTADGINSTLSSVKTTVDGQTTSINDLKADSSGFKAQFVTVNDTLGNQTKDIGTLQATNKSLSAGFDSLNADNTVNQHNISQLQLTATSLSNTIENVNQKVEDGLISTNIFRSANDFSRSYWTDTFGYPFTTIQTESRYHDSLIHYQGQGKTPAPYSTIAQQTITDDAMAADTWYTLSFYARGAGDNNTVGKFGVYFYGNGSDQSMSSSDGVEVLGTSDTHCIITLTPYFRRYVITFHTPKDFSGGHSFWARNDLDLNDGSLYCDFWHPKLELGKVASDFSVNPADTATISALSSISQTVDAIQTTVRGKVDNDTYQSKMTQLDNQITTKVSQGDITNENILPYSGYWSDLTGWTLMSWGAADRNLNLIHHNFYHNAVDATLCVGTAMADTAAAGSTKFNVIPNTTYTMTFWGFASSNVKGTNVYVLGRTFASTKDYDYVHNVQTNLIMSPSGINKYTATFTTNSDETQAYVRLDNQGSTNGQSSGAYFAELKIERGTVSTPYTRLSSGEIQVTSDNINLKVSKNGVINAINISPEGTTIYGNKLRITAATYIDDAVIKDAMIANLSANKLTAGSINAANINVYNINGSNIVANSITADKLQAGAMLIAMNSTLQTLKVGTDGLYTTNTGGTSIGKIHANNLVQHPKNWGLDMDLSASGQYMAWGAQNEGDPTGGYVIKFGWTRNSSASDFGMPWGGFWFNDNVMLHKNLRFDGGGIDVKGAYQLMKFAWISMNGIKYPFFGSSNLKAGWLFGSNETYLVRGGGVINASKILGVLNGQTYKFIKSLNPDGSVKGYVDVHF